MKMSKNEISIEEEVKINNDSKVDTDTVGLRIDLFKKIPFLKRIARMRSFQFTVMLPGLALFILFIAAGLFGNTSGSQNIIIVFVWILWWFLLIVGLVPFLSRIWCLVCPFPGVGEWLQRKSFARANTGKLFGLNKKWPGKLRNIWIQNFGFLIMAIFSSYLVTRPIASVIALGGIIILSVVIMLIYQKRAFCVYICPVGGFLGLYSMASTLELRVKSRDICKGHKTKECITGSESGYGCPWFQYPGNMERNNYCGLCMECVKTCPKDNIALNFRPFASDTKMKGLDEAWKAFIMMTLAAVYSIFLLGPWGFLKDWANPTMSGKWGGFTIYAVILVSACLVIIPAIYGFFVVLAKFLSKAANVNFKTLFIRFSYVLVPMGLMSWIAFSLSLVMVNYSYIITIISDPFGWGWNLFHTKYFHWAPFHPELLPYLQVFVLLVGMVISIFKGFEVAKDIFKEKDKAIRSMIPIAGFLVLITIVMIMLFAG